MEFQINGKQCGVTPSQDSDTLFLGNICKTWSKEAVSILVCSMLPSSSIYQKSLHFVDISEVVNFLNVLLQLLFQLKEKLKHYGVNNVEDVTLVEDSNNDGMNRGFAFLEFSSRSEAMDAFKRLQKRDVVFGVDRPAKVSFADSFIDPGDEIMAQVFILDLIFLHFIQNLNCLNYFLYTHMLSRLVLFIVFIH